MFKLIHLRNVSVPSLLAIALGGCVASGGEIVDPYPHPYPARSLNIPEGHMPPPGECRVWFPDRLPGQQPPPGNCYDLERRVPPGAVLVRG
jgi:hypothetical protein